MMKIKISIIFISCLVLLCLGLIGGCSEKSADPVIQKDPPEPEFSLSDFNSAEACQECHPTYYNEWRGSMHAYAFVDPINTIGMKNTQIAVGTEELGQFCIECHSPIGSLTGETPTGFNKENVDKKVREGINCDVCHLMESPSETAFDNPVYHYDVKSGTQYGSIMAPAENSFHASEGRQFYSQSKACLPCHDLINKTGLPVEITFTEWLESPFAAMGVECQDCHMETYSGQAATDGPQRENLHRHDFIGVDIALIEDFPNKDEQRQKIEQLLQNSVSLTVNVQDSIQANSTFEIETIVKNDKTGHDIPSSVTFVRQMWLEVTVSSGSEIIYKSGYFDANGDLMDEHSKLNPNGDPDLALFQSALYKNGEPANVFEADSIQINSIAPFKSKINIYSVKLPSYIGSSIEVKVRLRFRTFPPYSVWDDAPELIDKIPVFEMEEFQGTVVVN
jgi:hypothetical protein